MQHHHGLAAGCTHISKGITSPQPCCLQVPPCLPPHRWGEGQCPPQGCTVPRQSISHLPKQREHTPRWLKNQAINPPGGGRLSPGQSEHKLLALSAQGSSTHPAGLRNTFLGLSHPPTIYVPCANVVASGRKGSVQLRLQGFGRPRRDGQARWFCGLNGSFFSLTLSQS